MSMQQKIIKYFAVALAVWLIVSIIGGIFSAISLFDTFFGSNTVSGEMTVYEVSGDICSLDIEINAADIIIKEGDAFSVESNLKKLSVKEKAHCLSIRQNGSFRGSSEGAVLTVTVPSGTFDSINLKTGAGRLTAENLTAETVHFELGAGEISIGTLVVTKRATIESGTGRITVAGGALHSLDMETGVGEVNLTSALTGECELNAGIGKFNITLIGVQNDYALEIEKGIGSISVDGKEVSDFGSSGNGTNEIEIHGGIGAISINFKEESGT